MGQTEKKKMIIDIDGRLIEVAGGTPGPDSIGSEEIQNDSIQEEDLEPDLRGKISESLSGSDRVTREDSDGFQV